MPEETDDFIPKDDGEFLAWSKNFLEKLEEGLAEMRRTHEAFRTAKDKEDLHRLTGMQLKLANVPDAWPPPAALREQFTRVSYIAEPVRSRMLDLMEQWTEAIVRAGSPRIAPVIRGSYFEHGITIDAEMPPQCPWMRVYFRTDGKSLWQELLLTTQRKYKRVTDPAQTEDIWGSRIEFVVIGALPTEDGRSFPKDYFGAPSNIIKMKVPKQYPVQLDAAGEPV